MATSQQQSLTGQRTQAVGLSGGHLQESLGHNFGIQVCLADLWVCLYSLLDTPVW